MATRVLLLRHAESEWNAAGRWQGWADPGLSSDGIAAATAAARDLPTFDAVVSSDLRRAAETATILAGGKPVEVLRGLRERGAGEFTGLTRAEIEKRWPGVLPAPQGTGTWRAGVPPVQIPGGESPGAVLARAIATLHRVAAAWPSSTVLAVSHGALIRIVETHLGGTPAPVPNLAGRWIVADGALELEAA